MNDEIKEILRILKSKSKRYEYCLNANISFSDESYEAHLLLDYITNLQKEKDNLYLDNTMLKMEKDIYKTGYEELKGLLSSLQNGSVDND